MSNGDAARTMLGRRVLIVEDEIVVAMELENVLRQYGCSVLGPADTVEKAIALIEDGQPEAAVLDLSLNGKDALPVAAALNACGVPFVVATGHSKTRSQERELSGAPWLKKPVDEPTPCVSSRDCW